MEYVDVQIDVEKAFIKQLFFIEQIFLFVT